VYGLDGSPEQSASAAGHVGGGALHWLAMSYPAKDATHSLGYGHSFVPHTTGEKMEAHADGWGAWQQSASMSNPAASAKQRFL
jgi:hypothetical protein